MSGPHKGFLRGKVPWKGTTIVNVRKETLIKEKQTTISNFDCYFYKGYGQYCEHAKIRCNPYECRKVEIKQYCNGHKITSGGVITPKIREQKELKKQKNDAWIIGKKMFYDGKMCKIIKVTDKYIYVRISENKNAPILKNKLLLINDKIYEIVKIDGKYIHIKTGNDKISTIKWSNKNYKMIA